MIGRFVVKHLDKIYSTPIGNYTCEDVEYWGDSRRIKLWFSENNTTIDKLYIDLIMHKYFKSDRTIVCELQKKLYILTGMSREFFKGTEGFIYIVTLTSIEEPLHLPAAKFEFVAQDFPML